MELGKMKLAQLVVEMLLREVGDDDTSVADLDGMIGDFIVKWEILEPFAYFSSRKKPKDSASGKRYQRCFEKRLYVVEFVMGRRLTIANWKRKSFALRKRINWKQICAEWNEAHPHDRMSPAVLKVKYYRAIAEKDIQQGYFDRKWDESRDLMARLVSELLKQLEEDKATEINSRMHQVNSPNRRDK